MSVYTDLDLVSLRVNSSLHSLSDLPISLFYAVSKALKLCLSLLSLKNPSPLMILGTSGREVSS